MDTYRTLDTLRLGDHAVVHEVTGTNSELRNKLLSMGVVAQTALRVTNVAPLGDPISVIVRGFKLSLRLCEAESVRVVVS